MRRYYLDTSAYLCLLLGEPGSVELAEEIHRSVLLSSVLLELEATRSLVRLSRTGNLGVDEFQACHARMKDDLRLFQLRDLTSELCTGTELPVVSTPRSLDLAHLRTALWFHRQQPLTRFVTRDEAQRRSARELGLPV